MTAKICGYKYIRSDNEQEVRFYPYLDGLTVYVSLDDLKDDYVSEIEFNFTHEGLIVGTISVFDKLDSINSETYDELIDRLFDSGEVNND